MNLQNLRIRTRIGIALLLPVAGLVFLSLIILSGNYRAVEDAKKLQGLINLVLVTSELIHEIQVERAFTVGLVETNSEGLFAEKLPVTYQKTDTSYQKFMQTINECDVHTLHDKAYEYIEKIEEARSNIELVREQVAMSAIVSFDVLERYSSINAILLRFFRLLPPAAIDMDNIATISALMQLIELKEMAGMERAVGVAGFAKGRFDEALRYRFRLLHDRQKPYFLLFRTRAASGYVSMLDEVKASRFGEEIGHMRAAALSGGPLDIAPSQWFEAMSYAIDALHDVEVRIISDLEDQATNIVRSEKQAAVLSGVLLIALLFGTTMLAVWTARGVTRPLEELTGTMRQLVKFKPKNGSRMPEAGGGEINALVHAATVFRERLLAEEQLLKDASKSVIDAQEAERRRLARELHDEFGQTLTAIKLTLHAASVNNSEQEQNKLVEESVRMVEQLLQQVRELSLELRPSMLDDMGLLLALRALYKSQGERGGFAVHFETRRMKECLPASLEIVCYRMMQEVSNNIVRHAQARNVEVRMRIVDDYLEVTIHDDGKGFSVAEKIKRARQGKSQGLLVMEERAILAGGHLNIRSSQKRGTTVRFTLPLG